LIGLAIVGGLALVLVWVGRFLAKYEHLTWIAVFFQATWTKVVIGGLQALTALVAVWTAAAAADKKSEWAEPTIAGIVCLLVWYFVLLSCEATGKSVAAQLAGQLGQARAEADAATALGVVRTRLLALFLKTVKEKCKRIQKAIRRRGTTPPRLNHAQKGLEPKDHLDIVLREMALFLREALPTLEREQRNFRVGLYVETSGVMRPLHGISLRDLAYDPFRSHKEHAQHFRLDCTDKPAHAVTCVKRKSLVIVGDCAEAEGRGEFFFYKEEQRSYLRSMAACWVGKVCVADGTMQEAALVIDTDSPGYFREDDRESIQFCFDQFAARLSLEMALLTLVGGADK
jgi:hypothetical protein